MGERARRWLGRILVAGIWVAAGYYFLFGGEYSLLELRELTEEKDRIQVRVDSLRAVAESLERRGERLRTDSEAIERTARERYGFLRDGERLYRFVPVAEEAGEEEGTPVDHSGAQK